MNALEQFTAFGMALAVIVYLLLTHAIRHKLIDNRAAFLLAGAVWLIMVALYAWSERLAQPVWIYVAGWLGGWVATIMAKATVKDAERSE